MLSFGVAVVKCIRFHYESWMNKDNSIGLRARDLRRRQGSTLDELAQRIDISKGHLSRFERGEKSLSLAVMLRLAQALDTTVSVLTGEDLDHSLVRHVRRDSIAPVQGGHYTFMSLSGSPSAGRAHSTVIMNITAHTPVTADAFHGGLELMYLLDGHIQVEIGNKTWVLEVGDYLEFPGHIPHAIKTLDQDSKVLLVVLGANG